MQIEQIYTGCLAQGAYYIIKRRSSSAGSASCNLNLDRLERDDVKLKYIFETFHAASYQDILILVKQQGHLLFMAFTAKPDLIPLLRIIKNSKWKNMKALHTPGHTMESTTYY
jgi:hypothetical protein